MVEQRRRDRLRRRHAGQLVRYDGADQARTVFVIARLHSGQTGQGLHQRVIDGFLRVGTILAKAADRGVDDVRLHLAHRRFADAKPIYDAGAKVLNDDIAGLGKCFQRLNRFRIFQVQTQGSLVSVIVHERRREPASTGRDVARQVPCLRVLNLDHIGALISQQHGRGWA